MKGWNIKKKLKLKLKLKRFYKKMRRKKNHGSLEKMIWERK